MLNTGIQAAPAVNKTSFDDISPKKSICRMEKRTAQACFFIPLVSVLRPNGSIMPGFFPPVLPIFIGIMFNIAL